MDTFKIRRGLSSALFIDGKLNPRLVIEEGCWYLCTDTAWLFLGVRDSSDNLVLKRINSDGAEGNTAAILEHLARLDSQLQALESTKLFKRIKSESELPQDPVAEGIDLNTTFYIPLANKKVSTYIYDNTTGTYLCTNSVDELVVRAMVSDAIDFMLADRIEQHLAEKLPTMVVSTVESAILHGGTAIS